MSQFIPQRPPPRTNLELYQGTWRPTWAWAMVIVGGICGIYLLAIGGAFVFAFWRAALTQQPVPNMSAGLEYLLPAIGGLLTAICGSLAPHFTRSNEVVAQYNRAGLAPPPSGGAASPPTPSQAAPEFEGVNPHGGPAAP